MAYSSFGPWKNGFIQVNGVNMSDHAREISLDMKLAELPNNVHGNSTAGIITGLMEWTITAKFLQDFAAASIDATLAPLFAVPQTPFNIIVRADAGAVSPTNPNYSGQCVMTNYQALTGAHGSNLECSVTFRPSTGNGAAAGAGNLVRATS